MTVISKFGIERIPWLYKAIKNLLMLWMEAQQNNYNHNNNKAYKQIYICINLYHGKGHSIISDKFVFRYQDDSHGGAWCEDSCLWSLGNYWYKKDDAKIIYNTFITMIDDELLRIQNDGGL